MLFIVVFEGIARLYRANFSIWLGRLRHATTLDRLHEALGHAVVLRAANWGVYRLDAEQLHALVLGLS